MKNFTISPKTQVAKRCVKGLLVLLFWLVLWQLAAIAMNKPWLLPGPAAVAARGAALLPTLAFWRVVWHSLARIALGFSLGILAGLLLAVLTHTSRLAKALLSPALKAVLATPVASFSILLLILLRQTGSVPVMVAFLVVLPVTWRQLLAGIRATDVQLLEMARVFRLSRWRRLRRIYAPSLTPHFLAACSTGLGLAWKSGVAAEVISMPRLSIGSALQAGRVNLELPDVFVWTITVIILSLLIEGLLVSLLGGKWKVESGK